MTQLIPTPAWRLQAAVVSDLECRIAKGASFRYAGSGPNLLGTLKPYHDEAAIAAGVPRGQANLRLALGDGRLVYIEVMAAGDELPDETMAQHDDFRRFGITVHVVRAATEIEAVAAVGAIIEGTPLQM